MSFNIAVSKTETLSLETKTLIYSELETRTLHSLLCHSNIPIIIIRCAQEVIREIYHRSRSWTSYR